MSLSACEEPRQAHVPDEVPETAVTIPEKQQAGVSDSPQSSVQEESPEAAELRTLKTLKLELDRDPATLQGSPPFGAAPDSGWLDRGRAPNQLNADENALLPDLFDDREQEKPVDIKGRMLINEGVNGISDPLDGAEMSIELKTN